MEFPNMKPEKSIVLLRLMQTIEFDNVYYHSQVWGPNNFCIKNCIQQECIKEECLMNIRYTIIPLTWMSISLLYGTVGLLPFPEEDTSAGEQFEFLKA